jgi:hypothetical protein
MHHRWMPTRRSLSRPEEIATLSTHVRLWTAFRNGTPGSSAGTGVVSGPPSCAGAPLAGTGLTPHRRQPGLKLSG